MILRLLWLPIRKTGEGGFLYCRLNATSPITPIRNTRQNLVQRILTYGENKWLQLGQYPSTSIRGRIYGLGNRLIDRIPMQERMLWRAYKYMNVMEAGGVKSFPYLPPIEHGAQDEKGVIKVLRQSAGHWVAEHRKWRLIHGFTIVPAVVLSVLPFVKLWLAWEVFRMVTHHRALMVSRWLMGSLDRRRYQMVYNPQITEGINSMYRGIDEEIPDIIRKV